jgi:hypothetical protein
MPMQAEYLAVGEAPTEMRNVMRQRSRWTKGHMQVRETSLCLECWERSLLCQELEGIQQYVQLQGPACTVVPRDSPACRRWQSVSM